MSPASIALLIIGGALLISGVRNRSILNVILGNEQEEETGTVPSSLLARLNEVIENPDEHRITPGRRGEPAKGIGTFDGKPVARWIIPVLKWARANGWKGRVTSGFRTRAQQEAACRNTSGPCAEPGTSNHESVTYPGGAVDVTDYETLARLVPNYPGPGPTLIQATFANDPVHFSGNGH